MVGALLQKKLTNITDMSIDLQIILTDMHRNLQIILRFSLIFSDFLCFSLVFSDFLLNSLIFSVLL